MRAMRMNERRRKPCGRLFGGWGKSRKSTSSVSFVFNGATGACSVDCARMKKYTTKSWRGESRSNRRQIHPRQPRWVTLSKIWQRRCTVIKTRTVAASVPFRIRVPAISESGARCVTMNATRSMTRQIPGWNSAQIVIKHVTLATTVRACFARCLLRIGRKVVNIQSVPSVRCVRAATTSKRVEENATRHVATCGRVMNKNGALATIVSDRAQITATHQVCRRRAPKKSNQAQA